MTMAAGERGNLFGTPHGIYPSAIEQRDVKKSGVEALYNRRVEPGAGGFDLDYSALPSILQLYKKCHSRGF